MLFRARVALSNLARTVEQTMRTSQFFLPTLKETPSDAAVVSHQLMVRAAMIRQLGSGLYTWLPMGQRVVRKVEQIIHQEMAQAGALEVMMPIAQPSELWEESGRLNTFGPELFGLRDRHNRPFVLGPTHEEVVSDLVRHDLNSYKQLPLILYQIQTKFRDEVRPRFGVMRAREFVMKDAYSFHLDKDSLASTYATLFSAYRRIFERLGLHYRAVEADTGAIGGSASHEFHVLADSGEDAIAFSDGSDYAANIEKAATVAPTIERPQPQESLQRFSTPSVTTIAELRDQHAIDLKRTVKTLIVHAAQESDAELVALLVRADRELNECKAANLPEVASPLKMADEPTIRALLGAGPGSLGPVGLNIPCLVDHEVTVMADFVTGANCDGEHLGGVNWERDALYTRAADLRCVVEGDASPCGNGSLFIKRGIEVGHIFQLGDKYSQAMEATVLDRNGKKSCLLMGCYGIGVTRIVAAAIEQNHDERGIIWPTAIAPFQIALLPLKMEKSEAVRTATEKLYTQLCAAGHEVLLDDRPVGPGVKFADVELIGIPHCLVISDRSLAAGSVEYRHRQTATTGMMAVDGVLAEFDSTGEPHLATG